MTIDKLISGRVVYDVHSHVLGNTTMRTMGCWEVRVVSVDTEHNTVMASWNHNAVRKYYHHTWKKWRLKKPLLISTGFGVQRLATRAEIAIHAANEVTANPPNFDERSVYGGR